MAQATYKSVRIEVLEADITEQQVDTLVFGSEACAAFEQALQEVFDGS
ncbi:MAG: hypothetical protein NZL85_10925 [Fimbriimonadales bacterium]|nr:hypothetical protein [Fimbriimonadales bacterium]